MCSCACVPGVRIISVGVIECNRECIGVSVLCVPNCTYSTKRNVKLNARWRPDGPGTFIGGNHRSIPFVSFFLSLLILFFYILMSRSPFRRRSSSFELNVFAFCLVVKT